MTFNTLLISRGIRRGFTTLTRDRGWLSSLAALTGVLTLVQLFLLFLFTLQASAHLLVAGSSIRLEVQRNASALGMQEFLVAVGDLPSVERVEYVTREQAYERERKRAPDLVAFMEEFKIQNPFPDTVAVTLVSLDQYGEFTEFVQQPEWSRIVNPVSLSAIGDQQKEIEDMRSITGSLQAIVVTFSLLLFLICIALLVEFVRRRALARRDEIMVERVSGAPPFSLLIPFATESTVVLGIACVLSVAFLWMILLFLPLLLPNLGPGGSLDALRRETSSILLFASIPVALAEIIAIPLLSLGGAWLAIHRESASMR